MTLRLFSLFTILGISLIKLVNAQEISQTGNEDCQPCYLGDRPACEVAWAPHVNAVFVGTVVDVARQSDQKAKTQKLNARVKVDERFLGVEDDQVTVITGGNSCGPYPFSIGNRYLFYCKRDKENIYTVDSCGGTKWFSESSKDLAYLRKIQSLSNDGTILGTAYQYLRPSPKDSRIARPMKSAVGMKIRILARPQAYEILVGQDGTFIAENLPAGTYRVQIETIDQVVIKSATGFVTDDKGLSITIHAKGCAEIDFKVDPFPRSHEKR
jgi:hypothetical protein